MDSKKKLVFAILQGDDYEQVVRELNKNGFYVTLLNSVGGFLKKRSVTIMIGLDEARLEDLLGILREEAGERIETVYQTPAVTGGLFYIYFCIACFFIAVKLSSLTTCSIRQASSAAIFGDTPRRMSHSVKRVCLS